MTFGINRCSSLIRLHNAYFGRDPLGNGQASVGLVSDFSPCVEVGASRDFGSLFKKFDFFAADFPSLGAFVNARFFEVFAILIAFLEFK